MMFFTLLYTYFHCSTNICVFFLRRFLPLLLNLGGTSSEISLPKERASKKVDSVESSRETNRNFAEALQLLQLSILAIAEAMVIFFLLLLPQPSSIFYKLSLGNLIR